MTFTNIFLSDIQFLLAGFPRMIPGYVSRFIALVSWSAGHGTASSLLPGLRTARAAYPNGASPTARVAQPPASPRPLTSEEGVSWGWELGPGWGLAGAWLGRVVVGEEMKVVLMEHHADCKG